MENENLEENNKSEENDSNIEEGKEMARKKKGFKSDRQRKHVMAKLSEGRWVTRSYDETSSATFYIPKVKISEVKIPEVKIPEPEFPSFFEKPKRKTKKRR